MKRLQEPLSLPSARLAGRGWPKQDSFGGTPTEASETLALPKKTLMIGGDLMRPATPQTASR
jgi:hypothetical protein